MTSTAKHSPVKRSPSKLSHSPAKSPAKSLRDYFKSSSVHNNADNYASADNHASAVVRSSHSVSRSLDESFAVDLPPASQLDHSVLDALPPQLREKIMDSYNKRGQAVKELPMERITAGGREEELARMLVSSSEGDTERAIPQVASAGVGENCGHPMEGQIHTCNSEVEEEVVIADEDRFLEDWKSDIHEWVDSFCEGPKESDVLAVASHFCRLVNTNLKMVEVCLKIFRRLLVSQGSIMWCSCLNFLLQQIQAKVKTMYGGTLKVEPLVLSTT